jgi:hypothetical protein
VPFSRLPLIRNGFTKPPWFFVVPMVFGWRAGIVSGRLNGARSTHMGYTPLALTERLAEHSHDTWAQQRISEGWTYGPRRDDAAKQHPDLIPYAELPESEKEYDRQAALGTIRAIIALGYRIVRGRPVSR